MKSTVIFLAQNMSKSQCHFKDKHTFFIPINNAINPAVLDCKELQLNKTA